jgi:hypothetical protein
MHTNELMKAGEVWRTVSATLVLVSILMTAFVRERIRYLAFYEPRPPSRSGAWAADI